MTGDFNYVDIFGLILTWWWRWFWRGHMVQLRPCDGTSFAKIAHGSQIENVILQEQIILGQSRLVTHSATHGKM